ncbi:site-2 protease family protein [Bacillus massiliglaciei]|uniref:site-2 protease family protein n=1 Tax=Bacillus massiliglaciei TaxID=1816693 RepID=UPI000A9A53B7|nr:site-2 protease family protein [Bacillus massiliglaciei]
MEGLERFLAFDLEELPYVVAVLIIAFTVHEFSHAYVAYKFGDSTAKQQGRVTLNPVSHLDPLGTLFLLIAGFGWARPVPVNRFHFKRPRLAGILVSFAGPFSNFLVACLGYAILFSLLAAGLFSQLPFFIQPFLEMLIQLNIILFIFNLLPIPPLDGYRIIEDLAPNHIRTKMTQYEVYGSLIFLILVLTPLGDYTIQPIFTFVLPFIINHLNEFFSQIFF